MCMTWWGGVRMGHGIWKHYKHMRVLRIFTKEENWVHCGQMCQIFSFPSATLAELSLSEALNFKSAQEHARSAYFSVKIISNDSYYKMTTMQHLSIMMNHLSLPSKGNRVMKHSLTARRLREKPISVAYTQWNPQTQRNTGMPEGKIVKIFPFLKSKWLSL